MIQFDFLFHLIFLIALCAISGFIENHCPRKTHSGALLQGALFGGFSICIMLRPIDLGHNLFYDNPLIVISLCALYFGPWATAAVGMMTVVCRIWLGGVGTITGLLEIFISAGISLLAHFRFKLEKGTPSVRNLYLLGLFVHLFMFTHLFILPQSVGLTVVIYTSLLILVLFPLVTVLVGKILSGQIEIKRFLERLQEKEERYELLFNNCNDAVFVYPWINGKVGKFTEVNDVACARLGYCREELLSRSLVDIDTGEKSEAKSQAMEALAKTHHSVFEMIFVDRSGNRIPVELSSRLFEYKGKSYVLSIARDIFDRKQANNELQLSNNLLRTVIETAPIPIFGLDLEGNVQSVWNPAAEKLLGWSADEVMGRPLPSVPLESKDEFGIFRQQIKCGKTIDGLEVHRQKQDGTSIDYCIYTSPLFDTEDKITGNIALLVDITERKRAEHIMQARLRLMQYANTHTLNELLQTTLDEAEILTGSTIGFYHFLDADQETLTLQAWSTHTIEKMCTAEGTGSHYSINEAGVWVDCVRERRPIIHNDCAALPHRKGTPKGHATVVRELVLPVFRNNSIVAILGVGNKPTNYDQNDVNAIGLLADLAWDITERKRTEAEISKLSIVVEQNPASIVVTDTAGNIEYVNPKFTQITGYTLEEAIGKNPRVLKSGEMPPEEYKKMWDLIIQGNVWHGEFHNKKKNGELYWESASISPVIDSKGDIKHFVAVKEDITERKQAEEAFRQVHQNYVGLVNSIDGIVWEADAQTFLFNFVSHQAERLLGYPIRDWMTDPAFWKNHLHPDDREWAFDYCVKAVQERRSHDFEYRVLAADGRVVWLRDIVSVIVEYDQPVRLRGIMVDITERKKVEAMLNRLNRELRAISICNQVLIRAEDEQSLINDICHIVCAEAGYLMAWVGYAENDDAKTIHPIACAGIEEGYLKQVEFTWADTEQGRRPAGTAIRNGESTYIQDITTDPQSAPWRDSALLRGYGSSLALPLKDGNSTVFGALVIYSSERNAFTSEEIRLMEELAGDLAFGIIVLRSNNARKQAEQNLALMSFALNNVHEAAFLIDENAHFHYVNKESCRILQYSRDELMDLSVGDIDFNYPLECWPSHWDDLMKHGSLSFESHYRTKNGDKFPVEVSSSYFKYDGQGYSLALVRDISERKQAERERLAHLHFFESMDRINRAIQGAHDLEQMMSDVLDTVLAIFDCDRAWLLYPCDPEASSWHIPMERTRPEYPGAFVLGLHFPTDPQVIQSFQAVRAVSGPVKYGPGSEYPVPAEPVKRFNIQSMMAMALYPKVNKPYMFGLHQCSYARVWTPEEERLFQEIGRRLTDGLTSLLSYRDLRNSEEFLNNVVDNIPNLLLVKDAETQLFIRVNKAGERLLGYSQNELLGKKDYDFFPRDEADFFAAKDREAFDKCGLVDIPEETVRTRRKGERVLHTQKIPILDPVGKPKYLLSISEDITERKVAEEALQKSQDFIRNILDSVDEGFIVIDREYRIQSANRAYCSMVNLAEERVIGRQCYEVLHHISHPCNESGEDCAVQHTFETGITHFVSHTHEDLSGAKQYFELKSYPIFDISGKVVSVIETILDVTEKRKLEEQLAQSQKMEAVGRLAGGVAHDFNNMLGVIIGHTQLAMSQIDLTHPLLASLHEIRRAAERSADLTRQLLAFARKQTVTPKILDLNEIVEGMLKMLRRLIGEDIDLAWLPAAGTWPIKIDPSQIDQILANLCVNARDAIAGVGKVTIETCNVTIEESNCFDHPDMVSGEYVLLAISDNGCGMNKQILSKIFEPFFTTKVMGKGTGLGLAMVYGIVKQNCGFINVYSEPGQGSVFKIYLPRHAVNTEQITQENLATPVARGNETILLVEDEPAILNVSKLILEKYGYRVLSASTPSEAIGIAKEYAGEIHLLITDVVMPEMNGHDLAVHLSSICSEIKILFMSGYTGNVIAHHGVLDEGINFVEKPFTIHSLVTKVREALDRQ